MRLIDANYLVSELEYLYKQAGWRPDEIHMSLDKALSIINTTPTVQPERHGPKHLIDGEEI